MLVNVELLSLFYYLAPARGRGYGDLAKRRLALVVVGEGECRELGKGPTSSPTPTADHLTLVTLSAKAPCFTSPLPHMGGEGILKERF